MEAIKILYLWVKRFKIYLKILKEKEKLSSQLISFNHLWLPSHNLLNENRDRWRLNNKMQMNASKMWCNVLNLQLIMKMKQEKIIWLKIYLKLHMKWNKQITIILMNLLLNKRHQKNLCALLITNQIQ